jgi:hypothetical protein
MSLSCLPIAARASNVMGKGCGQGEKYIEICLAGIADIFLR